MTQISSRGISHGWALQHGLLHPLSFVVAPPRPTQHHGYCPLLPLAVKARQSPPASASTLTLFPVRSSSHRHSLWTPPCPPVFVIEAAKPSHGSLLHRGFSAFNAGHRRRPCFPTSSVWVPLSLSFCLCLCVWLCVTCVSLCVCVYGYVLQRFRTRSCDQTQ